jgi:hypothetical protein
MISRRADADHVLQLALHRNDALHVLGHVVDAQRVVYFVRLRLDLIDVVNDASDAPTPSAECHCERRALLFKFVTMQQIKV